MNQLWGPALEAELEYRRERATQAYRTPWLWSRVRTWLDARRASGRTTARPAARPSVMRAAFGEQEAGTARRAAQIAEGLDGLRPAGLAQRAA